jgi:hypothetical protein
MPRRRYREPVLLESLPALRKHLSAPGLLQTIRENFGQIADTREGGEIPLVDALMSGVAVFGLKYPTLLKFDQQFPL